MPFAISLLLENFPREGLPNLRWKNSSDFKPTA
jgi:hypothetical protein